MKVHLCALALLLGFSTHALAATPKVAKTVPDAGATDVDPALTEIRVTFDQEMSTRGFSWTGGGDTFPDTTGRPHWVDTRTCVLPVKLKPDWDYRLGINSRSAQNFKNPAGEPAEPFPLKFSTAAAKGPATTTPSASRLTPEQNRAALAKLKQLLDDQYSYRDRLGLNWDKLLADARPALESANTTQRFARELSALLANAQDIHIRVGIGSPDTAQMAGVYRKPGELNFDLNRLKKLVPDLTQVGSDTWLGRWDDGTAYILITNWSDNAEVSHALAGLVGAKRAIIDVRPNGGGDELLARRFAGLFTDKPVVYAKNITRDKGTWSDTYDRVLKPHPERSRFAGKAVLLQGPRNFSSNESFIQMMQAAGVTTVGQTTGGSSGNPRRYELGNGVLVDLPSWKDLRTDGTCLEGEGLKPDIDVQWSKDAEHDPVLEKGLELVRKG